LGGMRFAPAKVHRERVDTERPALWYVIWLGEPHADGSIVLGRAKRLRRHREFRFFPEQPGTASEDIVGFTDGMEWLLKLYRKQYPADS
jgi:hypothetical protein